MTATISPSDEQVAASSTLEGGHLASGRHLLLLAALGVVYGDIGTSPLYAFHESIHHVVPTPERTLGVLSLFFWSLTLVITVKYVSFIMRADNHGEGGVLALLALVPHRHKPGIKIGGLAALILFGTALLYGDGIITPAISVLSAVEGLEIVSDAPAWRSVIEHLVAPLTCVILIALFAIQRRGTTRVGRVFGPVMVAWFCVLAVLGVWQIAHYPAVLKAVSPHYAWAVVTAGDVHALGLLGSVVLCVTGGEALYADMGHFGRRAIAVDWYALVMPALLLNYFGQGALVLSGAPHEHTFWDLVPVGPARVGLVVLATAATVIASQALISGCYSLTRQAVQLGYFPRVTVIHTSRHTEGQIYIPQVNWALAVACVSLVLSFRQASSLAAAYGIAVTGTMAITTIGFFMVAHRVWRWPLWKSIGLSGVFLYIDLVFLLANLQKITAGGWVPLAVGAGLFIVMVTWKQGRILVRDATSVGRIPLGDFAKDVAASSMPRVQGTGVFMATDAAQTPLALLHFVKHAKALHEQVLSLSIEVADVPWVPTDERAQLERLESGIHQVELRFGFMQTPDVPRALRRACEDHGVPFPEGDVSYFVGRETLLPTGSGAMMRWRKGLFAIISRNAPSATTYFRIPPSRVVELGTQIAL